jgi:hypothetical protein
MVLEYLVRKINFGLAGARHDDCQDDALLSWIWLARLPRPWRLGLAGLPSDTADRRKSY